MFNFRGPLIKRHIADGDKVFCLCSTIDGYTDELYKLGVEEVVNTGFGLNIRDAVVFPRVVRSCIHKFEITHLHVYTITCILYFSILTRLPKSLKVLVCTFTGLGRLFGSRSTSLTRMILLFLLGVTLKRFEVVFFQNQDDFDYFRKRLPYLKNKYKLVYGSGIEVSKNMRNLPGRDYWKSKLNEYKNYSFICLMSARLVVEKGFKDFYAAADLLRMSRPDILFIHVGPLEREIRSRGLSLSTENLLVLPYSKDYLSLLALVDVFVLPSYYREGIPRSLIEAVLFNKPIVTTHYSGCKHAVIDGKNGRLVSPKSPSELADAILFTLNLEKELVESLGISFLQDLSLLSS
jgi:glycosyltransferase involved in cell wall biosynthesis